jgi:hypothetical protein
VDESLNSKTVEFDYSVRHACRGCDGRCPEHDESLREEISEKAQGGIVNSSHHQKTAHVPFCAKTLAQWNRWNSNQTKHIYTTIPMFRCFLYMYLFCCFCVVCIGRGTAHSMARGKQGGEK